MSARRRLVLEERFRRPLRDGLVLAGLMYLVIRFAVIGPQEGTVGADAYAYWALSFSQPYALPNGQIGAFLYSPPIARAFSAATNLSWPQFWWLWTGVQLASAIWLGWRRALLVLALPFVALELYFGNLNLLIAAAIALGFRYPAAWAFILLTKVTPGIGLIWFVVRREWKQLGIALGITGAIVAASLLIDRPLWGEWLQALQRDAGANLGGPLASPLWIRVPIAAVLVAWGARTDRPWTVPVGATIALPAVWPAALSVVTAVFAIGRPALAPRLNSAEPPHQEAVPTRSPRPQSPD